MRTPFIDRAGFIMGKGRSFQKRKSRSVYRCYKINMAMLHYVIILRRILSTARSSWSGSRWKQTRTDAELRVVKAATSLRVICRDLSSVYGITRANSKLGAAKAVTKTTTTQHLLPFHLRLQIKTQDRRTINKFINNDRIRMNEGCHWKFEFGRLLILKRPTGNFTDSRILIT